MIFDTSNGNTTMEIDMLIGYWELTTGRTIQGQTGPVAIHIKLGWVLSGPAPSLEPDRTSTSLITTHTLRVDRHQHVETLDDALRSFWDLETLGIKEPEQSMYEEFRDSIALKQGRYEVSGGSNIQCCQTIIS